jgi:hypothetical protein
VRALRRLAAAMGRELLRMGFSKCEMRLSPRALSDPDPSFGRHADILRAYRRDGVSEAVEVSMQPTCQRVLTLLKNDGSGNLTEPWACSNPQNFHLRTYDFAVLDLNNDGKNDLLLGLCNGYKVFIQE